MTAFSIGRVGVAIADGGDGLEFPNPTTWQQSGRTVRLTGIYVAASQAAAVFVVNQVLGLDPANQLDETAVPVYSSTVTELNGWFEVLSADATIGRGALGAGGTMIVEWTVTLARAAAWRRPQIELTFAYSGLVNGWGVTSADLIEALPGTAVGWVVGNSYATRTGQRGAVNIARLAAYTPGTWPGASYGAARFTTDVDKYYRGAAYVEDSATGLTYVGRTDSGSPLTTRIGNGLVRVIAGATAQLTFQWWNGSAWTSGRAFNFLAAFNVNPVTLTNATVLKNAADECILRLGGYNSPATSANYDQVNIDVSIRRGDRCARFFVSAGSGFGAVMAAASALAGTSKNYGMRSTSTVDSEYLVLTTDRATTRDLVNGKLTAGVGYPPLMFGLGVTSGGGTGTGLEDADGIGAQLMAVYGTTQKPVVN